jgi:hypothetical protein
VALTEATQAATDAAAALAAQQPAVQQNANANQNQGGSRVEFNVPPTVVFATTPVMVYHEDLIGFNAKSSMMVYEEGCKALTTPFDMKSNGTVNYITNLQAKCIKMGWSTGAQQITHFNNNVPPKRINVVDGDGRINVPTLLTACRVFCDPACAKYEERAHQHNGGRVHPHVVDSFGASPTPPLPS